MIHLHPAAVRQVAVLAPIVFLGLVRTGYRLTDRLSLLHDRLSRVSLGAEAVKVELRRLEVAALDYPAVQPVAGPALGSPITSPPADQQSPPLDLAG